MFEGRVLAVSTPGRSVRVGLAFRRLTRQAAWVKLRLSTLLRRFGRHALGFLALFGNDPLRSSKIEPGWGKQFIVTGCFLGILV